jgi:hypothetical protein
LPTGSLKDRSNSVGISVGKELGFDTATVMSTGNAAASLTVAIGAPQSAIDPEFGKLESIRIRLCLSGESHSSTAENRNALFFIALGERDRYASDPLAGLPGFRFKLNSVAAIRFCSHLECRSKRVMALSLHA